jgi:CheY-like chemotaxis protein
MPLASARAHQLANLPVAIAAALPELRILIIDDDPLVIESLRATLQADDHTITCATNGGAGIDAFAAACAKNAPFDLVITDLGMPYVDGRQVAAAVKARSPATPVILLTGWGHQMLADGAAVENIDAVVGKPPKLRELRAALAQTVSAARRHGG